MAARTTKTGEGAKVVPLRKARTCPICEKPSDRAFYPFCSPRCEKIDLNRWFTGAYAIPAAEEEPGSDEEGMTP